MISQALLNRLKRDAYRCFHDNIFNFHRSAEIFIGRACTLEISLQNADGVRLQYSDIPDFQAWTNAHQITAYCYPIDFDHCPQPRTYAKASFSAETRQELTINFFDDEGFKLSATFYAVSEAPSPAPKIVNFPLHRRHTPN